MSKQVIRRLAALLAVGMLVAACGAEDDEAATQDGDPEDTVGEQDADEIDYDVIGLWDDGPCDDDREPLVIGLMTAFETAVITLEDQAFALEAAAAAFNERGGANGACLEVHTCDDGGNVDQAVACVREIDKAGVVATVNDQGTAGGAEVSAAMADAGIPRIATNVANDDWGDQNAYPLDASGTGVTFLLPQGLIDAGATEIGLVRVDLPDAAILPDLLGDLYDTDAQFVADIPVPGGTTDFSQFVLAAENEGAEGIAMAIGEQEAVQVLRAGRQLGTDLLVGASLGTFPHSFVSEMGDFAEQMVFVWSFPPATADVPAYAALRADLAASGVEELQTANLSGSAMRSWLGLYALLRMVRDAGMEDFTRDGLTQMLDEATDVPMLGIFGGEDWTPDTDHPGLFQRAGTNHWATYRWDSTAEAPGDLEGNWVETSTFNFDEVLCGSPFGADGPC